MKMSLKALLAHLLKCDYVIEVGTSGIWTYRKWASGIAECWGKLYYSGIDAQQVGQAYRINVYPYLRFPVAFTETPVTTATQSNDGDFSFGSICAIQRSSSLIERISIDRPNASQSSYGYIQILCKGFWKSLGGVARRLFDLLSSRKVVMA